MYLLNTDINSLIFKNVSSQLHDDEPIMPNRNIRIIGTPRTFGDQ